jgi:hypothetical protein
MNPVLLAFLVVYSVLILVSFLHSKFSGWTARKSKDRLDRW